MRNGNCDRWRTLLVVSLTVPTFLGVTATASAQDVGRRQNLTTKNESNVLEALKREWTNRLTTSKDVKDALGKNIYGEKVRVLTVLLNEKYPKEADRRELIEILARAKSTEFSFSANQACIDLLTDHADREGMVKLLAVRCPRSVFSSTIEEWLVVLTTYKFSDGLLILCDAFAASESDQAKKEIAAALSRGMMALHVHSDDDKEMVEKSRRWYLQHKAEYVPNIQYDGRDGFDKVPLFVKKG